jgi:starch synthase
VKVLFAVSECVPFVKTGGLADVAGALPKELKKIRYRSSCYVTKLQFNF